MAVLHGTFEYKLFLLTSTAMLAGCICSSAFKTCGQRFNLTVTDLLRVEHFKIPTKQPKHNLKLKEKQGISLELGD